MTAPSSAYTIKDQQRMERARHYFDWQAALVKRVIGSRVLEVGCGVGNFTRLLLNSEIVVSIDVDPECVALHRNRFAGESNIVSLVQTAEDRSFRQLSQYAPDSIVCLNVLEHIKDDLGTLKNFRHVLPEGGRVVLMVPAYPSLYGPIDERLGHHRRYTMRSLTALAAACGLEPLHLRYMNMVGWFGWWLNARVFKRTAQSEGQIVIFDSLVVPWLRHVESAFSPPFGQSLFAVLRKGVTPSDC